MSASGAGDWRLELTSELDLEVLSYIRTWDGFLTAMHDLAPVTEDGHRVAIFNPGSNPNQVSWLRLINPGTGAAAVTISGVDDAGAASGGAVAVTVPAGGARTVSAAALETGDGVQGSLGDGAGKWRLRVESAAAIRAMSLLQSPTGHLTNLSTVPRAPAQDGTHRVPMFPRAADGVRQGFARVRNRSAEAGAVTIEAIDDAGARFGPATLSIGAGETVHFNSEDLEGGNPDKGLSSGVGFGAGDWRLELTSERALEVLAYIRTEDGLLTAMHDLAPVTEDGHRVAVFNPASNPNQISGLRLVNPGTEDAAVTIVGIDDAGVSPGGEVVLTIPAGASRDARCGNPGVRWRGVRRCAERRRGQMAAHGGLGSTHHRDEPPVESDRPPDESLNRAGPGRPVGGGRARHGGGLGAIGRKAAPARRV